MEADHRKAMGVRGSKLAVIVAAALTLCSQIALAQQTAAVSGDHVSNGQYTTELAANQQLQLEVVMALNHRDQLARLETALQDRDSPSYHQWLTPQQFADRFGPTTQQMQAVANWLASQGLQVTSMDRLTRTVHFAGRYSEVKKALATKILTDGKGYGNTIDPQVPSTLASTIVSIEGLRANSATAQQSQSDAIVSSCTEPAGCDSNPYFGPGDFYTFYDETSVINGGNLGTSGTANSGDCVAIPENASINTVALTNFVNQFQGLPSPLPSPGVLPPIIYTAVNPPVNGATPAATPGLPRDNEPYLDIEWVHSVSPNTPIRVYYTSGGYLNALQYIVLENKCGAISSSVEGGCDPVPTILAIDDVEAQATAQGQTFFKSSGDYGSNWTCGSPIPAPLPQGSPDQQPYNQSSCGHGPYTDANGNTYQPSIDEEASSPNITVVGGTEFQASYDSNGNDTSTVSDGLESAWNNNDTQGSSNCPTKDASGGGPSVIFNKPAWQTGAGVPNDGAGPARFLRLDAKNHRSGSDLRPHRRYQYCHPDVGRRLASYRPGAGDDAIGKHQRAPLRVGQSAKCCIGSARHNRGHERQQWYSGLSRRRRLRSCHRMGFAGYRQAGRRFSRCCRIAGGGRHNRESGCNRGSGELHRHEHDRWSIVAAVRHRGSERAARLLFHDPHGDGRH